MHLIACLVIFSLAVYVQADPRVLSFQSTGKCISHACGRLQTARAAMAFQQVAGTSGWMQHRNTAAELSREELVDIVASLEVAIHTDSLKLLGTPAIRGDSVASDREHLITAALALLIVYCVIFIVYGVSKVISIACYTNKG